MTRLQTTFYEINSDQEKLVADFNKKIDFHIVEMLQDVEQIYTDANVIMLNV